MIYDRIIEGEREQRNVTQYKETICKGQQKRRDENEIERARQVKIHEIMTYTYAGQADKYTDFNLFRPGDNNPTYTKLGGMKGERGRIVSRVDIDWERLDQKLAEHGITADSIAAIAAAHTE